MHAVSDAGAISRPRFRKSPRPPNDARLQGIDALRRHDFPIYGFDHSWTGRRWLGGWGGSDRRVSRIELAHGDAWNETAPLVRVESADLGGPLNEAMAAQNVARWLWQAGAPHEAIRPAFSDRDPTRTWASAVVPVDAGMVTFKVLAHDDVWGAVARVEHRLVTLLCRHVAVGDVRLVEISDVQAYIDYDGLPT